MIEQQRLDEETAERAEKAAGYIVAHLQKSKTPVQVFAHHDLETCKAGDNISGFVYLLYILFSTVYFLSGTIQFLSCPVTNPTDLVRPRLF